MIKILILDDDSKKSQKIREELEKIPSITPDCIESVADIISAKRLMVQTDFDLLLLDINIPNRFGQIPKRNGGVTFLQELGSTDRYRLPIYIIGITAYEDIYTDYSKIFSEKLWSVIKYEDNSYSWIPQITAKVKYVIDLKKGLRLPLRSYDFDIAFLVALGGVELDAIKQLPFNWEHYDIAIDNTIYFTGSYKNGLKNIRVVAAACSQMGMTAASLLSAKLITHFCPRYIFVSGINAGVKGKVNIGDILIADPSWDYGVGKIVVEKNKPVFLPEPQQLRLDADTKGKVELFASDPTIMDAISKKWPGEKPDTHVNIRIGPVGSGAAVLAAGKVTEAIKHQNRSLIGIDMETYGVFYSAVNCPKPRPLVLSAKSVCDFGDSEKTDTFQRYAAYLSSNFLFEFALRYI